MISRFKLQLSQMGNTSREASAGLRPCVWRPSRPQPCVQQPSLPQPCQWSEQWPELGGRPESPGAMVAGLSTERWAEEEPVFACGELAGLTVGRTAAGSRVRPWSAWRRGDCR
jgi:hypothetical protein